jgi:quercetin dioxygenase-like cupin family protein
MPVIHAADAPTFDVGNGTITGLASPSRGAEQVCAWHVELEAGAEVPAHSLDREEVLVVTGGRLAVELAGEDSEVAAGGAVVVPAGTTFSLRNRADEPVRFVAALTPGVTAWLHDGSTIAPPWAQ